MINARDIRRVQNDIDWLKKRIIQIEKHIQKHEAEHIRANGRGHESVVEDAKGAGTKESQPEQSGTEGQAKK